MALISCNECGHQVSDKASSCPNCGAPVTPTGQPTALQEPSATQPSGSFKWWLWLPVGAVVAFFAFGFSKSNSPEGRERARQRDAIDLCWKEQGRKSNNTGSAQFIAGACERMEADYERRHGRKP